MNFFACYNNIMTIGKIWKRTGTYANNKRDWKRIFTYYHKDSTA